MGVKLEYEVGPLKLNFRVLLEPKGFLRIIIAFIALLAFATTAGFNSSGSDNTITCLGGPNANVTCTATVRYQYPYDGDNFQRSISEPELGACNDGSTNCQPTFSRRTFYGSAQYFVAMGILTMLYVIGAILIYIMFITPDLFMAKYLVIVDLGFTIAFGVLYLLACIAWSVGVAQLNGYVANSLDSIGRDCFQCPDIGSTGTGSLQNFAQPAISLLFGWLATFIWFASIWFVYKDTMWHKDRTGPLAKLYQIKGEGGEAGETSRTKQQAEDQ